jgi:DNA-directed RNA polymerase subunit RPC12/RpoP
MKILDEPSKKPWSMEATCQQCGTRVELEIGDFKKRISDQRDGDAAVYGCPTCGKENWVDITKIPGALRHRLP